MLERRKALLALPFLGAALSLPFLCPDLGRGRGLARGAERRGEAFTFSLKLGTIEGGRARLAIAPPILKSGERMIHVVGEAEAVGLARVVTGLHDDYRLVLDADTLLPRRIELVETGLRSRKVIADLQGTRLSLDVTRADAQRRLQKVLPAEPRDPVAALLVMRAQPLRDGDRLEFLVIDGSSLYQGWVEVAGREPLQTAMGTRRAIRLRCRGRRVSSEGVVVPDRPVREATLWLSDDALRVPLRLQGETDLGLAQIELTSHEAPRRALPAPPRLPGVKAIARGL